MRVKRFLIVLAIACGKVGCCLAEVNEAALFFEALIVDALNDVAGTAKRGA